MRKERFKEKGITLVALVITIIILLILAGVTLNTALKDNGLFKITKKATESYIEGSKKEDVDIEDIVQEVDEVEKNMLTDGNVNYKKIGNDVIPIPKGFYYVGGTKESGVVISDNNEDEGIYANAEKGNVPSGADGAYNSNGTINKEKLSIKGNQFVWIPCSVSNYKKIDFGIPVATSWNEEYANSAELKQVEKYGGFYIGRFEAGTSDIKLESKVFGATDNGGWQSAGYGSDKVKSGTITEKPRRDTLLSFKLSNGNRYV